MSARTAKGAALMTLVFAIACGDDDASGPMLPEGGGLDAVADAGPDVADGGSALPAIEGLVGDVRAVQDTRGMWHIYGANEGDVFRVEGYLQARDRFGQLIFLRRAVLGELTEVIPAGFDPGLLDQDRAARFMGYRRHAEATWDTMQRDDPETAAAFIAYADGVNAYLAQVEAGEAPIPNGIRQVFMLVGLTTYRRWEPVDSIAIGKFLAASLSIEVRRDLERSLGRAAWQRTFAPDASDARFSARADGYLDLFSFAPAEPAVTADGFPLAPPSGAGGLMDFAPLRATSAESLSNERVDLDVLYSSLPMADAIEAHFARWFGDRSRGSNSWAIAADRTASGQPMLANDPHLALPSPPLHWQAQLNTKAAGGTLNVAGLVFAGTPLVLFGYNDDIAWGLTVGRLDVTDTYAETLEGDQVVFDPNPSDDTPAERRDLVRITETLTQLSGDPVVASFDLVPIGPAEDPMAATRIIIPGTRTETSAISIRWTGQGSTTELSAIAQMARAKDMDEALTALELFQVGGINWAIIDDREIYWRNQASVPVRDARALTFDAETGEGMAPCFVLPGTGEFEWLREADPRVGADERGFLESRFLPQLRNPDRGFLATANADPVGVTHDGNPFDAPFYIGWRFESHRMARIDERLSELVARGNVTVEETMALQNDHRSPIGAMTRDPIIAELSRADEEASTPGTHPDLSGLVRGLDRATMVRLNMARGYLEGWTLDADSGLEPDGSPISDNTSSSDSVATSIFNASLTRIHRGLVDDEIAAMNPERDCTTDPCAPAGDAFYVLALAAPERLRTYRAELGDTIVWDDLRTPETETRGAVVVRGVLEALSFLEERFESDDMSTWRWGRLHTLRLATVVPQVGGDVLSIPTEANEIVPGGFPRSGDRESVDVANFDSRSLTDFSYNNGAVQRLVVEMGPEGPTIYNAIPGGNAYDPDSPHHADEMEHWRRNEAPRVFHTEADVQANAETTLMFSPAQ
ncbi:MAG: penicillin acylase family protein [Myxococcota bacterium]